MPLNDHLVARHSPAFVSAWRSVYCDVYRWRRDGRFAIVPSLLGQPVFAYLPGLNYSDLDAAEAQALAREMAGRSFNIRAVAPPQDDPSPGTPAVLRLDLAAFGHDREVVWEQGLNKVTRTKVRRALKAGLEVVEETGPDALAAFSRLLSATLTRHGTPMMPTMLFEALIDVLNARILVVRKRPGGEALASSLWFRDGPLVWTPWGGSRRCPESPNNLNFWGLIEQALHDGANIVDFGRSRVGDGGYWFKRGFGAEPVPVLWLSDRSDDLYRRYALKQKLWRTLPSAVTDRAGPRLCRYLADY